MTAPDRSDPFDAFDQLATMVAVTHPDGRCLRANSALENTLGQSRRALQRGSVFDWLLDPAPMRESLRQVAHNTVATGRFEAMLPQDYCLLWEAGPAGTLLDYRVVMKRAAK